jgi:hypothetical protein
MADEGIILRAFNASITTYSATAADTTCAAYSHYLAASGALQPPPALSEQDLVALAQLPTSELPLLIAEDFFMAVAAAVDSAEGLDEYEQALQEMEGQGEEGQGGEEEQGPEGGDGEEGQEEEEEEEQQQQQEEEEGEREDSSFSAAQVAGAKRRREEQ